MILSGQSLNQTLRWVRGLVLAGAVLALSFGCSLAQEQDNTGTAAAGVVRVILDPDITGTQVSLQYVGDGAPDEVEPSGSE